MQDMETIPTIDISKFTNGTPSERDSVIRQVGDACEKIGFFLITGHGVPDDLQASRIRKQPRLFRSSQG